MGVEVEDEEEEDDEELPDLEQTRVPGTLLVAIYESEWFIAEVAKDQSKATRGYVNLSYTCIRGTNSFTWPSKPDIILTSVADPDPGSGIRCLFDPWIRDPEWVFSGSRIPDPKTIF
jgi:hypothetical protein